MGTNSKNKFMATKKDIGASCKKFIWNISNKRLAIFGFSFKANTNKPENLSIFISKDLLQEGAELTIFDPKVNEKQIILELQE